MVELAVRSGLSIILRGLVGLVLLRRPRGFGLTDFTICFVESYWRTSFIDFAIMLAIMLLVSALIDFAIGSDSFM